MIQTGEYDFAWNLQVEDEILQRLEKGGKGKVLITGGSNSSDGHLASAEVYDPATGGWSPAGTQTRHRADHTATLLADGRVLAGADAVREEDPTGVHHRPRVGAMTTGCPSSSIRAR